MANLLQALAGFGVTRHFAVDTSASSAPCPDTVTWAVVTLS